MSLFNSVSMREEVKKVIQSAAGLSSDFLSVFENYTVFPGFVDVHVHLREPGYFYKESIKSGTLAASHGGYTGVCSMPNLSPVPDCLDHLEQQLACIRQDAVIGVYPYASITQGQRGEILSDMEALAPYVAGFSDDGRGVQQSDMMCAAMEKAKSLGKIIVAHCEDNRLLHGGYIHDGVYAKEHGHRGICSESEWGQIQRDIEFVKKTGCSYHVCHISTKESVALIRQAKKDGLDITCETAPHYLVLNDTMLEEDGRFKMNPPVRSEDDRQALIEGLVDGTIDMIATDHAPHSAEEKSRGLKDSLMGVVGLETAFPILYTYLVKNHVITLDRLIELMSVRPRKRFGLHENTGYCVWDLNAEYRVDPEQFLSKGRATPFERIPVFGKCMMTIYNGKIVWQNQL